MKFSTEAVVAATVAILFTLLSFGAIVRERGQGNVVTEPNAYVAATNVKVSQIAAGNTQVLGLY